METVQIVLDKKLLRATDEAARRTRRNRSALVRDALREHLRTLGLHEKEERDRRGYSRRSQGKEWRLGPSRGLLDRIVPRVLKHSYSANS